MRKIPSQYFLRLQFFKYTNNLYYLPSSHLPCTPMAGIHSLVASYITGGRQAAVSNQTKNPLTNKKSENLLSVGVTFIYT